MHEFLLNFLDRYHKRGLKISFALKMKTTYIIERSNVEAYQSITGKRALLQLLLQDTYKSAFAKIPCEGRFATCI